MEITREFLKHHINVFFEQGMLVGEGAKEVQIKDPEMREKVTTALVNHLAGNAETMAVLQTALDNRRMG